MQRADTKEKVKEKGAHPQEIGKRKLENFKYLNNLVR